MQLKRWRKEGHLKFVVRLKTVIMQQNLGGAGEVARFAREHDFEVFYQPVERNYNTPHVPNWYQTSANWPTDSARCRTVIEELLRMQDDGYPIANSRTQLRRMIEYFEDPQRLMVRTEAHAAHEAKASCASLTTLQVQPNGEVVTCTAMPPIGNISDTPIRQLWRTRPPWWLGGCCMGARCSEREKADAQFPVHP